MANAQQVFADDVIYKSVGQNGEVTYAWKPDPKAVRTETITVDTLSPEQRRAVNQLQQQEARAELKADTYADSLEEKWKRVDQEIKDAQAGLRHAETALVKGRTPHPGERLGTVGGGSRLTQVYFDRIRSLELAVEQAKQRLDQAYGARNNLR